MVSKDEAEVFRERVGPREVVRLAWPIVVSLLSYNVMTLADSVVVARLGTAPLAAVGLGAVAVHAVMAFGMGLISGVKVVTSHATGAGDRERAARAAWQAVWLSLGLGLVAAALVPAGWALLSVMGASAAVRELAWPYFAVRVGGALSLYLLNGLGGWFQGRGDTRTAMVSILVANAVNVVLDPVLVFGWGPAPALGVAGAAWATVIGQLAGVAVLAWRLFEPLRGVSWRVDRDVLARIWRLGNPIGLRYLLDVGSFVVLASLLARAGDAELAAHVLVIRVVLVSFLPGLGVAEAAAVLVGQAVGARRPDRARDAWRTATWMAVGLMAAGAVVMVVVPDLLLAPFGADAEVVAIGRRLLYVGAAFQVFDAVATVAMCSLSGAGDTRFAMFASVGSAWLVKAPLAVLFCGPLAMGAVGAWLALMIEIAVLAALLLWRVASGRWLGAPEPPLTGVPVPG